MVQRRTARYVTNRYRNTSSVTSMLGDLEWDTLEIRRKKIRLTMMYKIINNLIDIRAEEYLTKPTRQTRSSQVPTVLSIHRLLQTVSFHRPPVFGIPCQHQLLSSSGRYGSQSGLLPKIWTCNLTNLSPIPIYTFFFFSFYLSYFLCNSYFFLRIVQNYLFKLVELA